MKKLGSTVITRATDRKLAEYLRDVVSSSEYTVLRLIAEACARLLERKH